jgi:hypothetical protein
VFEGDRSLAHLDDRALDEHISLLIVELRAAEREVFRRKAVLLTRFPEGWSEPPAGAVPSEVPHHRYVELLERYMERALDERQCRPGSGTYPWTEVWGLPGRLGPVPRITIRNLVRSAHEHARSTLATPAPAPSEPAS